MKKWKLLETTYPQKAERKHLLNAAQKFQFMGVRSYILMAQRTEKGQHCFGGDIRSGQKTASALSANVHRSWWGLELSIETFWFNRDFKYLSNVKGPIKTMHTA